MAPDATLAPRASLAPHATVARGATNKNDDDDIKIKNKSSSKGEETEIGGEPVENHTCAAAPREKETAEQNFLLVREAYEKATGNRWNQSDSEAYEQNSIANVPAAKIISVLEAVARRTPTKINSFKYFVKEITALSRIRATAPGRKSALRKSCTKSGIFQSAAQIIQWPISSRMSNAAAPEKALCSTTICFNELAC